jgi:hypothetical protein
MNYEHFGCLFALGSLSAQKRSGEYKRIASDHDIIGQVNDVEHQGHRNIVVIPFFISKFMDL